MQAGDLPGPDKWIADEDVRDAGAGEHLGLGELRHLDADRAGLDLSRGDLQHLVCLDVRAEVEPVGRRQRGRAGDVRLEAPKVDDDIRCVLDLGEVERRRYVQNQWGRFGEIRHG